MRPLGQHQTKPHLHISSRNGANLIPIFLYSGDGPSRNVSNRADHRTVQRARRLNVTDAELDRMLLSIGCSRVVHFAYSLIIYYIDEDRERFIVIEPPSRAG